jgi:hypothetical protein
MLAAGDVAAICPEAQFMDSVCAVGGMAGRVRQAHRGVIFAFR